MIRPYDRNGPMEVTMLGVSIRVILASLGLLAVAGTAKADCVSACQASTYCDSEMNASGECGRRLNDCYLNECNKTLYGALAYDPESRAIGWSYDFENAADAERKAMSGCSEKGSNCKIVYDFWNSCAALAAAADGGYSIDHANSREDAESRALTSCTQDGGKSCEIQAWSCSGL
jgi:hypothetical protein